MRRRSRYCISETSPPKPTTVVSAKERRRLTSVNRARDPYDAEEESFVSYGMSEGSIYADIPRLSAAITTPSLNLTAITEVPVTIGDCVCWFGPLLLWRCEASYAP